MKTIQIEKINLKENTLSFILDNLTEDLIGKNLRDLGHELSMSENNSGSWYCSYEQACNELISLLFEGDSFLDRVIEEYEGCYNEPLAINMNGNDIEGTHCRMMIFAVDRMWNDVIDDLELEDDYDLSLTQELYDIICEEIKLKMESL